MKRGFSTLRSQKNVIRRPTLNRAAFSLIEAMVSAAVVFTILGALLHVSDFTMDATSKHLKRFAFDTNFSLMQNYFNDPELCTFLLGGADPAYYSHDSSVTQNVPAVVDKSGKELAKVGAPEFGYQLVNMELSAALKKVGNPNKDDGTEQYVNRMNFAWEYVSANDEVRPRRNREILLLIESDPGSSPPGKIVKCRGRTTNQGICNDLGGKWKLDNPISCNIPELYLVDGAYNWGKFHESQHVPNGLYVPQNFRSKNKVLAEVKDENDERVNGIKEKDVFLCMYGTTDTGEELILNCPEIQAWGFYGEQETPIKTSQASADPATANCLQELPPTPVRSGFEVEWMGKIPYEFEVSETRLNFVAGHDIAMTVDPANPVKSRANAKALCTQGSVANP